MTMLRDRGGAGEAAVERELAALGVTRIAIPARAAPAWLARRPNTTAGFVGW
jgi:hypothetical protein